MRPIPLESLIMIILRSRREIWYNDLVQMLRAYYQDVTEREVLKALMRLELSRLIVVERASKRDSPFYIRILSE